MKKIKNILLDITEHFSAKYPGRKAHCQKCGKAADLDAYTADAISWIICEDCYRALEDEINQKNSENIFVPSNYLQGFLGSLLFSIPGMIVSVLFFIFMSSLAAVSSLVYVLLGIKGYKVFKGKTNRFGALLIMLSALIMIALGTTVSYSVYLLVELYKEYNVIDFDFLKILLGMPEVQQELMQNIVMSFAISGVYLSFQFFQMMKEWRIDKTIKAAREI